MSRDDPALPEEPRAPLGRWLDRGAIVGAVLGTALALGASWLAASQEEQLPFTILLVLAVGIIGLVVGSSAALWAFLAGTVVFVAVAVQGADRLSVPDVVRLAAYLLGTPAIVYLVDRGERLRAIARAELSAAEEATRQADAERAWLEEARRELDEALDAAERERARLEEVAESIPEPLIVYDDHGQGTYGNRAALRLFGRSFVERPPEEWARVADPRDEHGHVLGRGSWPQVQAQRESFRRRLTLRIPMSGRDVIVDVEGTPIPGGGAVLLLRDIGKEEDERRRLSRFASFVAHELRNPLAVAKARIELAQRDPDLTARAGGHAARALESVDAAIGILERLELFSRAETGHIDAERMTFELRPAVAAAIERLRARGSDRQVIVRVPDAVMVSADRHLTEQAITNLLTNADRYSRPGGAIWIEVGEEDPVTLRVRDEGPGLSEELAQRLFRDRLSAGRGLGLGLFLVNATMTAMGGSVQLEERSPAAVFALRFGGDGVEPPLDTGEG